MKRLFILLIPLLLASCSVFSPIKNLHSTTYELNAVPTVAKRKSHSRTLLVLPVEAESIYNTTEMVYTLRPYEISYFAKNHWAETPAQMLQPLIVQTLQNTHFFHAVSSNSTLGHYDYILSTQLLKLQQEFTVQPSVVRLTLRAQLVDAGSGRIISTKQFSVVEPAAQNNPYGGVIAANKAVAKVLTRLTKFCLKRS
jgi:cholesterol transport system auxiliary component